VVHPEITMGSLGSYAQLTKAIVALGAGVALTVPAVAIDCNGPYQIIQGQEMPTPYCEDNYLGAVARSNGVRVSDEEIRQNPNKKGEVCRFVGYDNRVREICWNYLNDDSRD
jgi:hypothetical protein